MKLFKGIFDKHGAEPQAGRHQRRPSAVPAVSAARTDVVGTDARAAVAIDESIVALSQELSGLAQVQVSQAARERGWASLQRELEHRPVRATAPVVAKGGGSTNAARPGGARRTRAAHSRSWRWALGSAAAAVAVIATLLGAYGGGLLQTADNGNTSTTLAVVSSDTTAPSTTVTTSDQTTVTGPITTDGTQPGTTQGSVTTGGTGTTTGGPGTTGGSTGTSGPSTTQPSSPTTTGDQQNAAKQRETSARSAAFHLGDLVVTGNTSGARALVTAEAQASLVQMITSLNEPYGYRVTGARSLTGNTVRVTMEVNDRVSNGRGELEETVKRFAIQVRVDSGGAVITAIGAGS
jgi:hypothetical protein